MAVVDEGWKYTKFFPGVGRMNLLSSIKQDLEQGIQIVVMTGLEGVGKSVVRNELVSEGIEGSTIVVVKKAMESFDDLVFLCCEKLGISPSGKTEQAVSELIDDIGAELWRRGERLILVLDSAETLYLASLERIRKMIEQINSEGLFIQVLFIGRPALLNNLERLEICDFPEVPEMRYVLEPLRRSETIAYIERYVRQLPEEERELFTPEGIDQMYQRSLGNLHIVDKFIEDTRSNHNKDRSFWVLLDNVEEGIEAVSENLPLTKCREFLARIVSLPKRIKVAGLAAACILIIWLVYPDSEKKNPEVVDNQQITEEIGKDDSGNQQPPLSSESNGSILNTVPEQKADDSSILVVQTVEKSKGGTEESENISSTEEKNGGEKGSNSSESSIYDAEIKYTIQESDRLKYQNSITVKEPSENSVAKNTPVPVEEEVASVKPSRIERQEKKKLVVETVESENQPEVSISISNSSGEVTSDDIPTIQAKMWKKVHSLELAESMDVKEHPEQKVAPLESSPIEQYHPALTSLNSNGSSKKTYRIKKAIIPEEFK